MVEPTPDRAAAIVEACQAGLAEATEALTRTFDYTAELSVGEAGPFAADAADELVGPGLVLLLKVGQQAAALLLAESSGLLPEWYAQPDPTGQSKLDTLAQELGMLLLPESLPADDFQAARVDDLGASIRRGAPTDEAVRVALSIVAAERTGVLHLVWPLSSPATVLRAEGAGAEEAAAGATADAGHGAGTAGAAEDGETASTTAASTEPPAAAGAAGPTTAGRTAAATSSGAAPGPRRLPPYTQSLLRIAVPVKVRLAVKRQSVSRILELGPGSLIQFDKSCEELLELCVADEPVALGEAVKVGEKFGLRVAQMVLPPEKFESIQPPSKRSA